MFTSDCIYALSLRRRQFEDGQLYSDANACVLPLYRPDLFRDRVVQISEDYIEHPKLLFNRQSSNFQYKVVGLR